MNSLYNQILHDQVKPATGCTEPVAIALACAKASQFLEGEITHIKVRSSKGVFKNANDVGIPGTKEKGMATAVYLGALMKAPDLGMRILEMATEDDKKAAQKMAKKNLLDLSHTDSDYDVFVEATLSTADDVAVATIAGCHDHFIYLSHGDEVLLDLKEDLGADEDSLQVLRDHTIKGMLDFSRTVPLEDISWLREMVDLNKAVCEEGLSKDYGLSLGRGIKRLIDKGHLADNASNQIRLSVAAAVDARMGGAKLPVMTSCGSGNQGILISLSLYVFSKERSLAEEDLLRALALANLINAFAKSYLGKLSPLCGGSISAGLGAAAGLTFLAGGSLNQIEGAIKGMVGNLAGTLCDGAKPTCALKLETAAATAVTYALLAIEDVYVDDSQGVVEDSCEGSVANLEKISRIGMENMDSTVLDVLASRINC